MNYPLILVADDGPHLYDSADELIRHIEPTDVDNGEYAVYDSEGRWLPLVTEKRGHGLAGLLLDKRILLRESSELKTEELRKVLIDFLHRAGRGQANDPESGLSELLQRVRDFWKGPRT
jgi:hypothetical protein